MTDLLTLGLILLLPTALAGLAALALVGWILWSIKALDSYDAEVGHALEERDDDKGERK